MEKITEKQIIHKFDKEKTVELGDGRWEISRNPEIEGIQSKVRSPLGWIWVNPKQKKPRKPIKIPVPSKIKNFWNALKKLWTVEEWEKK